MIIDISAYNGNIDFNQLFIQNDIEKIILRGTVKSGDPDSAFFHNLSEIRHYKPDLPVDVYKFTYAFTYTTAVLECTELIYLLDIDNQDIGVLWLDIEPVNGRVQSKRECTEIIAAYNEICKAHGITLGIYCSYGLLCNMPSWAYNRLPFWVARWGEHLGDVPPNTTMWQYSSNGKVPGIPTDTDLSRYV